MEPDPSLAECLHARERCLLRQKAKLERVPQFKPGTLIESPAHQIRRDKIERLEIDIEWDKRKIESLC